MDQDDDKQEGGFLSEEDRKDIQGHVERLQARLDRLEGAEVRYRETLYELEVHQEELRTQNEDLRLATLKAEENSRRYHDLFDNSPVGYFVVDASRVVSDLNFKAADLLGRDRARVLEKPFLLFVEAAERKTLSDHYLAVERHGRDTCELAILRDDGGTVPVILESTRTEGGGFLTSALDNTERHRAQRALAESERRFRAIADYTYGWETWFGPDGRVHWISPGVERLTGYRVEECLAMESYPLDMVHDDDRPLIARHCATVSDPKQADGSGIEFRIRRPDGDIVWATLSYQPMFDVQGRPMGSRWSVHDTSLRKSIEDHLHQALDDLAQSNHELSQFAYVASHDLKEPLRTVTSYLQLFEKRYGEKIDADGHEYLDFAVDGAKRMHALIQDLLTFSRVSTQGEELAAISAREVADEALGLLEATVTEAGAQVSLGDLPEILGDRPQLMRVFQNLIGNAIKYRDPVRAPRIGISAEPFGGDLIRFTVRDNGEGIEPRYFDRIFMIFQRLHGRDDAEGTGIGLAVCKRIVERHGGRIWVESTPGEGSVFHFTLRCV